MVAPMWALWCLSFSLAADWFIWGMAAFFGYFALRRFAALMKHMGRHGFFLANPRGFPGYRIRAALLLFPSFVVWITVASCQVIAGEAERLPPGQKLVFLTAGMGGLVWFMVSLREPVGKAVEPLARLIDGARIPEETLTVVSAAGDAMLRIGTWSAILAAAAAALWGLWKVTTPP